MKYKTLISFHVENISRGDGRCAVQMAAYCARAKYYCDYTGKVYDYTGRSDLIYHEVLLPANAPAEFQESEQLWNAVERVESCRNSRLARSVIIALPKEFGLREQVNMAREYVEKYFVSMGMCADASIHDKGDGNPHVHLLLTTRSLDRDGQWMWKQKRNYLLDENGNRIINPVSGKYMLGKSIKNNDWDSRKRLEEWRRGWADACNEKFRELGIQKDVTHMSYARQGIRKEPMVHLGVRAKALEDRGIMTDRGNINRAVCERNKEKDRQFLRQYEHTLDHERDR